MDILGLWQLLSGLVMLALLLLGLVLVGLVVEPAAHPPHEEVTTARGRVPVPDGLPAPVAQHFASLAPGGVPRFETAVLWGRMRMKLYGLWMPVRFRTYLEAGRQFTRRMDICWFGVPLATAVDRYVAGAGWLEFRHRAVGGPMVDQGQRLALWVESLFAPSFFLESSALRWEPVGEFRARLKIDAGQDEPDTLTFDFHPQTGRLITISAPRYRAGGVDPVVWRVDLEHWQTRHGVLIPTRLTASWEDEGSPYGRMRLDGIVYNVEVATFLTPPDAQSTETADSP